MKDLLEFDGIELSYGAQRILSGIYMKCTVGEVVGILGRNGSGKSSLFKVVFGSQSAEHRSIRMNSRPLPGDFIRRRIIAYLPQSYLLPPYITIAKALDLYGIESDQILKYFPELNGQLKSQSRFCLLDEPFSGVMPAHVETIRTILMEAKSEKGIILTDHLYRSVMSSADRLYILSNGSTYPVRSNNDLIARGYLGTDQPLI
jgi:ABC-type multidrug transport system ATPase subunit